MDSQLHPPKFLGWPNCATGLATSDQTGLLQGADNASNYKLQTQRSLLSEMLASLAGEVEDGVDDTHSEASDDEEEAYEMAPSIMRQNTDDSLSGPVPSRPVPIPCTSEFSTNKQRDAYRRYLYQQQLAQQLYQQQQAAQQQARGGQPAPPVQAATRGGAQHRPTGQGY